MFNSQSYDRDAFALEHLQPAVTQNAARADRTERYVQIPTTKIITLLEGEGYAFQRSQVKPSRSRVRDPLFARHQVIMRRAGEKDSNGLGLNAEIIIDNSSDGSSSLRLMAGIFRFICSNGLIVGTTFGEDRIRHSGNEAADVLKRVAALSKNTAPLFAKIEQWSRTPLTTPQATEFARLASVLRWGTSERFAVAEVLRVRRAGDDAGDLWSVLNRIQENTVRGGLAGLSLSGRAATSRPLSAIDNATTFNSQLWTLAEEFAEVC